MGPPRRNAHKLLATTLAVKTLKYLTVLLQLDSQTSVACINNMGGTVSPHLTDHLVDVGFSKNIILTAECKHTRGSECGGKFQVQDRMLHPKLFHQIKGPLQMDLTCPPNYLTFSAGNQNHWLRQWTHSASKWETFKGYVSPPRCLIGKVMSQVQ